MATQNTLTKEATITQLFGDVERFVNQGDYSKAFRPIDKILQLNPNDNEALQCRAVTYIRLEKYQSALDVLTKGFPDDKFILEKAYCLYRLNRFSEVAELLRKCRVEGYSDLGIRYLEAQMAYKVEDYDTALEVYHKLLQETDKKDDTYNDILTNFDAAKAALLFSGNNVPEKVRMNIMDVDISGIYTDQSMHIKYATEDSHNTYELAYNSAWMCKESLSEEDYSEEEIEQELSTINVQLAYVFQLQGQISEAIDIYQSVLKSKGVDITASAIASNNLVAAKKDTELFDSVRKIKVASANALETKLFRSQRRIIAMNEALLLLYMHKYAACHDAVRKLLQVYPENDDLYLIIASTSYHQKKNAKAIQDLQEFAKTRPHSLSINFALMQLQILQSNPLAALETFESYWSSIKDEKEKYKPGYVGLLVWLYEQAKKQEKAVQALEQASAFWKSEAISDENTSILKQTAAFKLKIGRYREAAQDYEQLVKNDPLDSQALAGLVAAYSQYDISLAEKYESSLLEIGTPMDIDVESLEKVVPGIKKSYIKKTDTKASVPPDPERWLPKRERTTYKVKGKRKQQLMKGSQGTAVTGGGIGGTGSANIFGRSNVPSSEATVVSSTIQQEQPSQKSKSSGGDKNKRKKKKGGNKW
ncbi:6203_t:CDS:10 [Acaulospora colombiana]|uniref:6203_t:CDS:1 n=1 Tax=Acaulospora colombiana TaxID=27376 RepID=A0ACA9LK62_9GLOM|nr:6203_t:CDS:10 [Acaulospora colombiana]